MRNGLNYFLVNLSGSETSKGVCLSLGLKIEMSNF